MPQTILSRIGVGIWVSTCWTSALCAQESLPTPTRFELLINGENFVVESGTLAKLESKAEPGVVYRVAVRPAEYQPWRMNTLQFDYHRGFSLRDDEAESLRAVTLHHGLGFDMVIGDLGTDITAEQRAAIVKQMAEDAQERAEQAGGKMIRVIEPRESKFGAVTGVSVVVAYDMEKTPMRSVVILLQRDKAAATCMLQYAEADQETALGIVRPTLESIAPLK